MQRVDVVIVGGGLAGTSTAWHLSRTHRVVVVEQASQPGTEASAQNAGMQRRLAHDRVERDLAIRAGQWLDDLPADFRESPPARVVGAVLALARDPSALDDGVAHLRASDIAVADCTADLAAVAPAMRGTPIQRAWHVPGEALLDANALIQGFVRGLRARGGVLRTGTEVRLALEGARVVGVDTPTGRIEAEAVVVASGAWSGQLTRRLGLHRPLMPLARHLLSAHTHPLSSATHPYCWIDDLGLYVRPEAAGWLCSPCDETATEPLGGPGSRGPVDPFQRAWAIDKIERFLPALSDIRFTGGWTGLRTFAPDRRPMLGPDPSIAGLHWATGLGGFGVTCAFSAGEVVAERLRGNRPDWLDVDAVAPGRRMPFSDLPAPDARPAWEITP